VPLGLSGYNGHLVTLAWSCYWLCWLHVLAKILPLKCPNCSSVSSCRREAERIHELSWDSVAANGSTGKIMRGACTDKEGRPVLLMRCRYENEFKDHMANLQHFKYQMEMVTRYVPHFVMQAIIITTSAQRHCHLQSWGTRSHMAVTNILRSNDSLNMLLQPHIYGTGNSFARMYALGLHKMPWNSIHMEQMRERVPLIEVKISQDRFPP
jgi:hypothetical protein